jgi:hypothetical protein
MKTAFVRGWIENTGTQIAAFDRAGRAAPAFS